MPRKRTQHQRTKRTGTRTNFEILLLKAKAPDSAEHSAESGAFLFNFATRDPAVRGAGKQSSGAANVAENSYTINECSSRGRRYGRFFDAD